jgi:hypothetical protein
MISVSTTLCIGNALLGDPHPPFALEMERLGDHPDRQDTHFARGASDHERGPTARAAAHPGGDEHHVGAREVSADLVQHLFGRRATDIGTRAGAEPCGHLHAHLDDALGLRHGERLDVGIGDDKIDPLQPRPDHVVHGVSARTAHPKHRNPRLQLPQIGALLVDAHACLFDARASCQQVWWTGPSLPHAAIASPRFLPEQYLERTARDARLGATPLGIFNENS